MPNNLQKVIKVTQAQYDILAAGGTVGSYTGLNSNYVYLVVDENEYLPTTGGDINGALGFLDRNGDTKFVFNGDYLGNEIIYLANDEHGYMPLFADANNYIIYSSDSDYYSNITFNTLNFKILDALNTGNYFVINQGDGAIYYYDSTDDNEYEYDFPHASGTLALESYVEANPTLESGVTPTDLTSIKIGDDYYNIAEGSNIVLNDTVGSESITDTDNNITLNVVTRDTEQTFTATKYTDVLMPRTTGRNIGASTNRYNAVFANYLNAGTSITTPSITDGTNSITIANIQEKVQVKRYI